MATLATYGTVLALLAFFSNPWLQAICAVGMAFIYVQVVFLLHDVCHHEVCASARTEWRIAYGLGVLLLGSSWTWWRWTHTTHHVYSNQLGRDTQMVIDALALAPAEVEAKFQRWGPVLRLQQYYAVPLMLLLGLDVRMASLTYAWPRRHYVELTGMAVHWLLYFGFLFRFMGLGPGLLFLCAHQALFGLVGGAVTSPNHWGMPLSEEIPAGDYLRQQVITSRNIRGGWLMDVYMGGLNHQIEHHLFPTMPRNNLRKVAPIVREFCLVRGIPYHQVGFLQGWRESLGALAAIVAGLPATRPSLA